MSLLAKQLVRRTASRGLVASEANGLRLKRFVSFRVSPPALELKSIITIDPLLYLNKVERRGTGAKEWSCEIKLTAI